MATGLLDVFQINVYIRLFAKDYVKRHGKFIYKNMKTFMATPCRKRVVSTVWTELPIFILAKATSLSIQQKCTSCRQNRRKMQVQSMLCSDSAHEMF